MLIGMEESTIKDYLDSQTGKYSEAHADAATKKHLASGDGESIERVNDLSESTFGVVDHYYHLFPNQHVITAAGVAQCIINHDMDIHYVNSRARKPTEMRKTKASAGERRRVHGRDAERERRVASRVVAQAPRVRHARRAETA